MYYIISKEKHKCHFDILLIHLYFSVELRYKDRNNMIPRAGSTSGGQPLESKKKEELSSNLAFIMYRFMELRL